MDKIKAIQDFIIEYAHYFTFFSFVLAIAAMVLAYVFFKSGRRYKRILGTVQWYTLIKAGKSLLENIEIKYKGQSIDNLSIVKLRLQNAGTQAVKQDDVAPIQPITFKLPDNRRIVDREIVYETNEAINATTNLKNEKELIITFDYMNPDDEIIINLTTDSSEDEFELTGTLIGDKSEFVSKHTPATNLSSSQRAALTMLNRKFIYLLLALKFALAAVFFGLVYFKGYNLFLSSLFILLGVYQMWTFAKSISSVKKIRRSDEALKLKHLWSDPLNPKFNEKVEKLLKTK